MIYNWQQPDWLDFKYDLEKVEDLLFAFAEETGHISGMLKTMPEEMQLDAMIELMVAEAVKTSAIEGEILSRPDVKSSIKNNLGLNERREIVKDKKADGAGKLMVAVRNNYSSPLTEEMLFTWHKLLLGANTKINIGAWRTHSEPMQVVSGILGKEKIHYEAPPSKRVPAEMKKFIKWFNDTAPGAKNEIKKAPVRAAIAHLYFESIHPFEDGNGRIGRAIAEKVLSQSIGRPVALSLSQAIEANKAEYYSSLEKAQRSNMISDWIHYFLSTILEAQLFAKKQVAFTLKKAAFFDRVKNGINDRQLKVINRMLEAEPEGFVGGMTAKKYISLTKASKATATRDLQILVDAGVLQNIGGGRSTHYQLKFD